MTTGLPRLYCCITALVAIASVAVPVTAKTSPPQYWYVDDDTPNDPGPGDPSVSDPLEDGSVEHPFDAIQEAIDAASDGDEVVIFEGTYTGDGNRDLDYFGKAITVRSSNPQDPTVVAATIIDCQGSEADPHRGFKFQSNESASSVLAGLTITHGYASEDMGDWYKGAGGAIYSWFASPTIQDCILINNWAAYYGGGIFYLNYESPIDMKVINCTFSGNVAHNEDNLALGGGMSCCWGTSTLINCTFSGNLCDRRGAGLHIMYCNNVTILNCTFEKNGPYSLDPPLDRIWFGPVEFSGGGMWIDHTHNVTMTDCTFRENSAVWGGGLNTYHSYMALTNCVFGGNSAQEGGGIWNSNISNLKFNNCTFVGNQAEILGGGLYDKGSYSTLTNCTFSHNTSLYGGGIAGNGTSKMVLANCIFWENAASYGPDIATFMPTKLTVHYSDIQGGKDAQYISHWGLTWGDGIIDADPLFARSPDDGDDGWVDNPDTLDVNEAANNDYGDLHLQPDSPCIDVGNNDLVPEYVYTDLDGNPRFADGDDDGMAIVDMGTYEFNLIILAGLDVLPDDDPNMIVPNKKSKGRIPMAIFGSAELATEDIDPDSIRIAGTISPLKISTDKDLDGDGLVDLVMHISRRALIDALSLDTYEVGAVVDVTFTAYRSIDGRLIKAMDSIVITGRSD